MELAESSAAEMSVAEPVEEAELEQPGRAVQACRSEVTSPEAAARNRSRSRTAAGEPAPSPSCPGTRRKEHSAAVEGGISGATGRRRTCAGVGRHGRFPRENPRVSQLDRFPLLPARR